MSEKRAVGGFGTELGSKSTDRVLDSPDRATDQLMTGEAWEAFCDRLREAGRHVIAETAPGTPLDRAEGFRHLANLTQAGIRHAFSQDPLFPRFLRNPDSTSKAGAENADNVYFFAKIRSDQTYRIRGVRNTASHFLLEVKEGYMQLGDVRNFATLESEEVRVDGEGRFEIVLSATPHEGNWVELHPDATQVLIRQYLCDWETERLAEFEIINVDREGASPEPLTPLVVARLLDEAGQWVEATQRIWNEWSLGYRERRRDGILAPAELYVGGADDIRYGNDAYVLNSHDDALLIEVEVPDARYWHFQLVDLWMASNDFANRQTSLNYTQLHIDDDHRVRVVISSRDPGVPNWLDTGGHLEGLIQYRYVWTRNSPQPTIRSLPVDEVSGVLPQGTPAVTPEQRRAAIARRQAHLRRREPLC
ncbi:hypothetical protein MK489_09030 [Myxococcota bacterium]|nr:hypothetical protein [Myxococcota bacterium]